MTARCVTPAQSRDASSPGFRVSRAPISGLPAKKGKVTAHARHRDGPGPRRPLRGWCDLLVTSREPRRAACARAHLLVRFPPCRGTRSRITSGLEIGGVRRPSDASFAGSPAGFDPIRRQLTCLRFPVLLIRFLVPSAIAAPSRTLSRVLPCSPSRFSACTGLARPPAHVARASGALIWHIWPLQGLTAALSSRALDARRRLISVPSHPSTYLF